MRFISKLSAFLVFQFFFVFSLLHAQFSIGDPFDYGHLIIDDGNTYDLDYVEESFSIYDNRIAFYYFDNVRFELIAPPGYSSGDTVPFEMDFFDEDKICFGNANIDYILWDHDNPSEEVYRVRASFSGDCFDDTTVSGTVLFNAEIPEDGKKISLEIEDQGTRDFIEIDLWERSSSFIDAHFHGAELEIDLPKTDFFTGEQFNFYIDFYNGYQSNRTDSCYGTATVEFVEWASSETYPYVALNQVVFSLSSDDCDLRNDFAGTFSIVYDASSCDRKVRKEVKNLKDSIDLLSEIIDNLTNQLSEFFEENEILHNTISVLEINNTEQRIALDACQSDLGISSNSIDNLSNQLSKTKEELEDSNQTNNDLKQANDDLKQVNNDFADKNQKLQDRNKKLKRKLKRAKQKLKNS